MRSLLRRSPRVSTMRHSCPAVLTLAGTFLPRVGVVVHPRAFRHTEHVVVTAGLHVGDTLDQRSSNLVVLVIRDRCRLLPVDIWLTLLFRLLRVTLSVSVIAVVVTFFAGCRSTPCARLLASSFSFSGRARLCQPFHLNPSRRLCYSLHRSAWSTTPPAASLVLAMF